ncbi:hypothetical protein BJ508DRAFT_333324 [Ascobolus immersus RN42]|uniref:Uncharacterized protein n=1 Tax=Ascobolus immersus RN42 TaxID=1160509 RepID=A0A3N4HK09_ASCIM|nr:hypothetical protein BJ508DRAFT_333324 [Ascobolus immersus RN42]
MTIQQSTEQISTPKQVPTEQNDECAYPIHFARIIGHSFLASDPTTTVDARSAGHLSFFRFCNSEACTYNPTRNQVFRPLDRVVRCLQPGCTAWRHESCESRKAGEKETEPRYGRYCTSDASHYTKPIELHFTTSAVAYPTSEMHKFWRKMGIDPYYGMYHD